MRGTIIADAEMVTMAKIVRLLQKLPYPSQERVFRYLQDRYAQMPLPEVPMPPIGPSDEKDPDRFAGALGSAKKAR